MDYACVSSGAPRWFLGSSRGRELTRISSQPPLATALTEGGVHSRGELPSGSLNPFLNPSTVVCVVTAVSPRSPHPFILKLTCRNRPGLVPALCSERVCVQNAEVVNICVTNGYVDVEQNGCACLFACTCVRARIRYVTILWLPPGLTKRVQGSPG